MSLIPWPFSRKEYPGVGNPRFVSDIVAANQAVIDAMKAITGLGNSDFAIITGLEFTPGTPNGTYAPGIFYLNGSFYYLGASFGEGLYLAPNPTDVLPQPFQDGISRLTYTLLSAISTSNPSGSTPIFNGAMNAYRIGLKLLKADTLALQATIATLGNAAFRNVGTISGTVAAGDDSRFGYTQAQIDTLFSKKTDVILKGSGIAYTPTAATDPVNKQYADAAAGDRLLWLGNISPLAAVTKLAGPLTVTAIHLGTGHYALTHNNGNDNNFYVRGIGIDASTPQSSPRSFINASGFFDVFVSNDASADDAAFQISMHQFF